MLTSTHRAINNGVMAASAPRIDPLIAAAKFRMRRRRTVALVLALLVGVAALAFLLRPWGTPGTSPVKGHNAHADRSALAHLKVPVDSGERTWQKGTESAIRNSQTASGLTRAGAIRLHKEVVSAAQKTGATIVRFRVWPRAGSVELVLATAMNPAEYLVHHLPSLVTRLAHGDPYVKVVNARGAMVFEWYYLQGSGMVGYAKGLDECGPIYHSEPVMTGGPPSCPVK